LPGFHSSQQPVHLYLERGDFPSLLHVPCYSNILRYISIWEYLKCQQWIWIRTFSLSYNKADRDWAEWIAWQLEEAGYTTIIQSWDFSPGRNFVLEMDKAAKEAKRTIAVLSPDYLK
jgi:TIR domain-containing protein